MVFRLAAAGLAVAAILLAFGFQKENVAFMSGPGLRRGRQRQRAR